MRAYILLLVCLVESRRHGRDRNKSRGDRNRRKGKSGESDLWHESLIESIHNKDLIYDGYRSNSTSLTIEDIYEKLENLTMRISDVEKFESRIENMNLAIARLEQQMIEVWNPTPAPIDLTKIPKSFNRLMLISSDNPDLPTDIIDLKSQERSSFKRQNPVLVWNCLVTYQGFVWSLGGRHSEQTIYRLNDQCHFQESQIKLPRGYISHECVVHDEFLYLCPDWELSTTCTKLDYVSGKLLLAEEIPMDTERFLSSLVSTKRGLMVIGGRTLSTTAVLQNNYFAAGPSLPYNIAEAASIEVNENIYVIGGKDYTNNRPLASIFVLHDGSDFWYNQGTLQRPKFGHTIINVPNSGHWILGGDEADVIQIFVNGTVQPTDMFIDRRPGAQAGLIAEDLCLNVY